MTNLLCLSDEWRDWIHIGLEAFSIIATILVALFAVNRIQKKIDDSRHLKDFYINEISSLKEDYCKLISDAMSGIMNIKIFSSKMHRIRLRAKNILMAFELKYNIKEINQELQEYLCNVQMIFEDSIIDKIHSNTKCFKPDLATNKKYEHYADKYFNVFFKTINKINDATEYKNTMFNIHPSKTKRPGVKTINI